MKHKLVFSSLLLALSLASAPTARAITTWYVDGVSGSDSNNCQSPTTACRTIGHAISRALSGDSISVAAATYKENLSIAISLTITGSSAQTTVVDGGGVNTVVVISNTNAHVSLSNLTIQNGLAPYPSGKCGGGINNGGTLTISNDIIRGNSAGPPCGGGGIYNAGTLTVNNSTISGNQAGGSIFHPTAGGGGIRSDLGTLTVNNSTISGNRVYFGGGGGIRGDAVTVNNSTISGNSAYPGQCAGTSGWLIINNGTISGNSGRGICGNSALTLQNSIVANNSKGNCLGVLTSSSKGYNLSSDGTCNFSNSGDRNNTDPLLGPLQNNGGPTQTMALQPGSPAIDAGNPSGCRGGNGQLLTTDQRGQPRPDHEDTGGCDMGAYEKQTD